MGLFLLPWQFITVFVHLSLTLCITEPWANVNAVSITITIFYCRTIVLPKQCALKWPSQMALTNETFVCGIPIGLMLTYTTTE